METLLYFLLWAGLIFLMMRYGCGTHIMGHGHKHGGHKPGDGSGLSTNNTDPVCGMTVDTKQAKSSVYNGRAFYFCSPTCRDKFEASPAVYAKAVAGQPSNMEPSHDTSH